MDAATPALALFIRRAANIVALSERTAALVATHYRLDATRCTVIPNAVPGANFRVPNPDERATQRERFGLPPSGLVIAYVGALVREKGVESVLRCVATLGDATALIVGDGPDRDRLVAIAARLPGVAPHFVGSLDDPLAAFLASDLIVLPSEGGDSMPATLIEAGLCGLPTISTPVGAIEDIIIDGETGRIVPIGDDGTRGGGSW